MAASLNSVSTAVVDVASPGTSHSGTANITIAAGTNTSLFVFLVFDTAGTGATATWNGVSMSQVGEATDSVGGEKVYLFYLRTPATGNLTLASTYSSGSTELQIFAIAYDGVDQSSSTSGFAHVTQTNNGSLTNGATATLNITSAVGNAVIAGFANDFTWATPTPCNNTQLWALNGAAVAACGNRAAGAASVAMSATNNTSADNYCAIGCDVVAAAAAAASAGASPAVAILRPGQGPSRGLRAVQAFPPVAVQDTPLTAAFGSFVETGEPVIFDMKMPGAFGSFTETGEPALLGPGIAGAFGSFVETGEVATFDMQMPAAFGSFAETGEAAVLGVGLTAAFGSFTETGEPVIFDVGLTAAFGGFVLTGEPVTFTASGSAVLAAGFGAFVLTGEDAILTATGAVKVGWPGRRIKREELERRLKEQRDNTFGRRRWAELKALEAAEEAASRLAIETESKAQRKALEAAAQAARDTARATSEAQSLPVHAIDALTLALEAATSATRIKVSLDEAKRAVGLANAVMAELRRIEDENDEEEAIALLLMH